MAQSRMNNREAVRQQRGSKTAAPGRKEISKPAKKSPKRPAADGAALRGAGRVAHKDLVAKMNPAPRRTINLAFGNLSNYDPWADALQIAFDGRRKLSAKILALLAVADDVEIRARVAGDERTPQSVLHQMALAASWHRDREVIQALAGNPHVSGKDLQMLASMLQSAQDVRGMVNLAGNPNTPTTILSSLASCKNGIVRLRAAMNPMTPPRAVGRLARDDGPMTRAVALIHPNCPTYAKKATAGTKLPSAAEIRHGLRSAVAVTIGLGEGPSFCAV